MHVFAAAFFSVALGSGEGDAAAVPMTEPLAEPSHQTGLPRQSSHFLAGASLAGGLDATAAFTSSFAASASSASCLLFASAAFASFLSSSISRAAFFSSASISSWGQRRRDSGSSGGHWKSVHSTRSPSGPVHLPSPPLALFASVAPLATIASSPLMRICMARAALASSVAACTAAASRRS